MEDIRTKSENTTPRQRAAAQIPKEAMRQLWLRSKEKGRTEIESTADGQQGGQYSEANQTGEKVSDALQSVGKSSAKVAVHKGRELAKKRAGQRHMEQSVERQEQTGQQSFSELQAPDGGQVSSNLTEPRECSVPSGKENPSANHSRISDSAKQTSDRNIKSNRLSVKEKPHDIKTAPHEIRGVSRDRKQIRTAASTVQAEQVAQQKAQQMAQRTRQAAKNASKQTRKAVKAVRAAIRHFLAALHTLTVAIIAGMSAATAVVVIICLVAFIAGSAYGIFSAAEAPDESSITVQQAVEQLTGEYRDELEHISDTVPHDRQEIEANDDVYYIRWQDVLAVFSSRVSGAEDGAPVAALDETRLDELREILWDMNEVSYTTREETVEVPAQNANTEASRDTASESTANDSGAESQESNEADTTTITQTVLTIHLTHKTPEEMQTAYNFTARQAEYLPLLQDPEYETLWAELLGGFAAGSSEILMPDTTHTPTGTLQWPLPIPGSITSPFGYRTDPLTGETSYHDGTDIAVPESTPILADADGTVTVANALDSWGGSYGYYVQIDHSSGLQTLYPPQSKTTVRRFFWYFVPWRGRTSPKSALCRSCPAQRHSPRTPQRHPGWRSQRGRHPTVPVRPGRSLAGQIPASFRHSRGARASRPGQGQRWHSEACPSWENPAPGRPEPCSRSRQTPQQTGHHPRRNSVEPDHRHRERFPAARHGHREALRSLPTVRRTAPAQQS